MTPIQYYFPYFFHLGEFNKQLLTLGLSSYEDYNSKTEMPDNLLLTKINCQEILFTIPFGATLMVQEHRLFYWKTNYDLLDITQIQLDNKTDLIKHVNQKIDLLKFRVGDNYIDTDLALRDFVTYVRKEDLKYQQEYYEKFVVVIISNRSIKIIPFDWFNKTGGDYGYVWPATARLDQGKIYGQGMRMKDFVIDLDMPHST